jgi:hypothetical protein
MLKGLGLTQDSPKSSFSNVERPIQPEELRRTSVKKVLTLIALTLLTAVIVSEAAFAADCPPGKRYYNGRCV